MAINRYDVPAQDNYFNTFVGLPYGEIMNTVQARQAQVDRAQAQMDQAYEQAQLFNYIPNSEDERKIKEIQSFMQDWSEKYYNQDMSNPVISRQAMNEYRTKLNRPLVKDIQDSYAAWRQNQEVKRRYQAEGKYNPLLDEDPATGYDTSEDGVYSHMTPAQLDIRMAAERYFDNLEGSLLYGSDGKPKIVDGYNMIGVTKSDINRVINERWRDFADTPEGKQAIIIAAKRRNIDPNELNKDQKLVKEIATEILGDVGYGERVWEKPFGSRDPQYSGRVSGNVNFGNGELPTIYLGADALTQKDNNYRRAQREVKKIDETISNFEQEIEKYNQGLPNSFKNEQDFNLANDQLNELKTQREQKSILIDRATELVDNEFKQPTNDIYKNLFSRINNSIKKGKMTEEEGNEIIELLLNPSAAKILWTAYPSVMANFAEKMLTPNAVYIRNMLAGAVNKGNKFFLNLGLNAYEKAEEIGLIPDGLISGDDITKMREAVSTLKVLGTNVGINFMDKDNKSEIITSFIDDFSRVEKDKQKAYREQYSRLEEPVKQEGIYIPPNYKFDLASNQYTAYVGGTERRASGLGQLNNTIKNVYDAFKYEKVSDENTLPDKRKPQKALKNQTQEEMKKLLKSHNIIPVGTGMRRNDDGSLSVYVTPQDENGVQKGIYRVDIPAEYQDLINQITNDLVVEKPTQLVKSPGSDVYDTQIMNPNIYRLKFNVDGYIKNELKKHDEFIIMVGGSPMRIERVGPDKFELYHKDNQSVFGGIPRSLEETIQTISYYKSYADTFKPI